MNERLSRLRTALETVDLVFMLVTKMENVRYLSGFSGSSGVALVTPGEPVLITDGRYREQAAAESAGWDVRVCSGSMFRAVADAIPDGERCGFEVSCSFDSHRRLCGEIDDARLEPLNGVIEELRMVKDAGEVDLIRAALVCAAEGFDRILGRVKPGISERELAAELDYRMTLAGADGPGFDTVVASGGNSALPHAPLTDRKIEDSDIVVMDFGARKEGYRSDTTRTVLMPRAPERARRVCEAVRGALERALEALQPGMKASDADAAARVHMERVGFAEQFSHALGHGVGLETHERPTLSAISADVLEPGMVFTVEPGAYIQGFGGVRIEEMVLMTERGPEVLTSSIP